MRPIKFIYIILLALLSFFSNAEFCKHSSEFRKYHFTQDIFTTDVPELEPSTVSMSNDLKARFTLKKKAKPRVEESENRSVKNLYHTSLFNFQALKDKIIYSIAAIYDIQRHILLHLYHLF